LSIKQKIKEALMLFLMQLILYGLLCINFRAVALADYHEAAISDFIIASMNFFVIKKIASTTDSLHQWIGYSVGSLVGSYLGIYISLLLNT